jgi:uncharacterized protein
MVTCKQCDGECCKYVTVSFAEPEDKEDWDEIKWWLMHKNVKVYKDTEGDWIVEFSTPCKNLGEDNKCQIYETRPQVCRDHSMDDCDANDGDYADILFEKPEEVDEYLKKNPITED